MRTVVINATMPVGKVIGEFDIGEILRANPRALWKRTKDASGISRAFFDEYFEGRTEAIAIAVSKPRRHHTPLSFYDVSGTVSPPQSYQYIS